MLFSVYHIQIIHTACYHKNQRYSVLVNQQPVIQHGVAHLTLSIIPSLCHAEVSAGQEYTLKTRS